MNENNKAKFRIKVDDIGYNKWSFGICVSHWWEETYLYINLFKWTISIGFMNKD